MPLDDYLKRRTEVLDALARTLVEALDLRVEPDEIDPDAPLFGSGLRLDSIDALELVVAVETAFGGNAIPRRPCSPPLLMLAVRSRNGVGSS